MVIQAKRDGETLVIKADGRIDGANSHAFQEELESAIGDDDRTVILSLESLLYISSAGIRVILMTAKTLQRRGGRFALSSLSEPIREVFEISGFDKIISVHASLDEALSAT